MGEQEQLRLAEQLPGHLQGRRRSVKEPVRQADDGMTGAIREQLVRADEQVEPGHRGVDLFDHPHAIPVGLDAVERGIVCGQPREIQLGELRRLDLTRLHQLREMRHRQEGQRLVARRLRHERFAPLQAAWFGGRRFARRNRVEYDGWLRVVAEIGGHQKTKPRQVAAGRVQPGRDRLLLLAGERDAGESLRRLDHLDGDGVGSRTLRTEGAATVRSVRL